MFFSIAWRNAKRSRSENLIYFLTMVTAIATFYIVLSLGEQDVMRFLSELESDAVDRLLTKLLPTVYLCALLFVFSLVIFANKYQLECRSRELGLYLLFGMTKPRLFIQIMAEGLISSLLALLGGLICGGFLSEISDNGTGIPVSDLPFVFDKGFTGDTGSYLSRSTGMGLYLVRQMANDLTLKVSIFSNANGGTTVTLMFPKVEQPLRR